MALSSFVEVLTEGAALVALLSRVGAPALPLALALRAAAEVVASLCIDRWARPRSPWAVVGALQLGSALLLALLALLIPTASGPLLAFVVVGVLTRLRVIHFGVLALAALASRAARTLPVVYGLGRAGAILAGPALAIGGSLGPSVAFALGAAAQAAGALWSHRVARYELRPASEADLSVELEAPASLVGSGSPATSARGLLAAIVVGSVALAIGRLALTTQSGAILEARFDELALARVLGLYFALAGTVAVLLQLGAVGRWLQRGALPVLNLGWATCYLLAQAGLSLLPPSAALALGARAVESELRNAVRTPIANLLYEVLPPERRAQSRTWVIGVALPLASVVGGLTLAALKSDPTLLAALGMAAAVVLVLATAAQNRAYLRAIAGDARRKNG